MRKNAVIKKPGLTRNIKIQAQDLRVHNRSFFWYVGMVVLTIAGLSLALLLHDYLLVAVVLAVAVAISRLASLHPHPRAIQLSDRGVYWGDRFFGYHQLKAFWVTLINNRITIYLDRLNLSSPISFIVSQSEAEAVIEHLTHFLPWHDHRGEPLPDQLSRLLQL